MWLISNNFECTGDTPYLANRDDFVDTRFDYIMKYISHGFLDKT